VRVIATTIDAAAAKRYATTSGERNSPATPESTNNGRTATATIRMA